MYLAQTTPRFVWENTKFTCTLHSVLNTIRSIATPLKYSMYNINQLFRYNLLYSVKSINFLSSFACARSARSGPTATARGTNTATTAARSGSWSP